MQKTSAVVNEQEVTVERIVTENDIRAYILILPRTIKECLSEDASVINIRFGDSSYKEYRIDVQGRYVGGISKAYRDFGLRQLMVLLYQSELYGILKKILNLQLNLRRFNMSRDFNNWLAGFRNSIADYGYYIDFGKVHRNVDGIKVELNILNSLIASKNIKEEFKALIKKYPEVLKCIPLLLAVRANEIYCQDENGGHLYQFNFGKYPPNSYAHYERYTYFMEHTGLFDLLENHIINNLVDYATGVETGLDSNGRKNRGGHLMEDLVESFIKKAGFVRNVSYFKEMYIHQITDKWGVDLSAISNQGKMEKRFDFVVKTPTMIYGIETNFYGSGGSKLNETARSYKTLATEADTIDGFTFVWFTDGKGWTSARHNLEETFDVMDNIYSIKDLEDGIITEVFK